MSRFINLELGQLNEDHSERHTVAKDETFYLREAQIAYESADFERGLRSYARVLEHNPQNPMAWTGQVRMLIELNEVNEAKLWADKALERFPKESRLLAAKAVALGRRGDLEEALAFSDAAFEERGDSSDLWLARGDVFLARKEKRSHFCFEKAVSQAHQSWFDRWLAARILHWHQQHASAFKYAASAVEANPAACVAWLQLGLCQRELGLTGAAESSFSRATELNPDCSGAITARQGLTTQSVWTQVRKSLRRLFSS